MADSFFNLKQSKNNKIIKIIIAGGDGTVNWLI
jgi:hypothetical protein